MDAPLDLRDLEAFLRVVDEGSFTAAAKQLLLSQPSVSARISKLEALLGAQLLERGPRVVVPTPAGKVLLIHARSALRACEQAKRAVHEFSTGDGGELDVAASSVPGTYLLPPVLARLHRVRPRLAVKLHVLDSEAALDALRRAQVEVAVVGRAVRERGLNAEKVGEDEVLIAVRTDLLAHGTAEMLGRGPRRRSTAARRGRTPGPARPKGTISPLDLRSLPIVLREPGSATRRVALDALADAGLRAEDLNVVLELGSSAAALEAVRSGAGATFVSSLAARELLKTRGVVALKLRGHPMQRPLTLVRRSGRTLSPGALALIHLLRSG
jgi:DNA-binding transcriptional LysR family regulator